MEKRMKYFTASTSSFKIMRIIKITQDSGFLIMINYLVGIEFIMINILMVIILITEWILVRRIMKLISEMS